jgi:hypothetical protein
MTLWCIFFPKFIHLSPRALKIIGYEIFHTTNTKIYISYEKWLQVWETCYSTVSLGISKLNTSKSFLWYFYAKSFYFDVFTFWKDMVYENI